MKFLCTLHRFTTANATCRKAVPQNCNGASSMNGTTRMLLILGQNVLGFFWGWVKINLSWPVPEWKLSLEPHPMTVCAQRQHASSLPFSTQSVSLHSLPSFNYEGCKHTITWASAAPDWCTRCWLILIQGTLFYLFLPWCFFVPCMCSYPVTLSAGPHPSLLPLFLSPSCSLFVWLCQTLPLSPHFCLRWTNCSFPMPAKSFFWQLFAYAF